MNRNALCRECLPADRTVSPDSVSQELLALRLSMIPPVMALNPVSSFSIGGILNSITSGLGSVLGGGGGAAAGAASSSGNWLNNLMQIGGTLGGLVIAKELGGGQQSSGGSGQGIINSGSSGGLVSLGGGQFYNPATGQIITSATGGTAATGSTPSWVMPAAVIGGGLLLYLALKKK